MAKWRRYDPYRTACGGDGLFSRSRKGVGFDTQSPRQLAPTQHFDQTVLVGQALITQRFRVDDVATEGFESVKVHDDIFDPKRILESLQLRNPLLEGQLAAFEARLDRSACGLSFGASARSFSTLPGDTAAHAPALPGRVGRWL